MSLGNRRCIGVYMNWPESAPYQREFLRGVHQMASETDIHILTFGVGNLQPRPEDNYPGALFLDSLEPGLLDGVILLTSTFSQSAGPGWSQPLRDSGIPLVSVGEVLEGIPSIVLDNRMGFADLMVHLFGYHGYRNPVFVAGPKQSWDSNDRLAVYLQALSKYGLDDSPGRIFYGDFTFDSGRRGVEHLLDTCGLAPDVFVCANDLMAIGVRQTLAHRGLAPIPVTGFDAIEVSSWLKSPITSVRQPMERTGREAFELMRELLDHRPALPLVRYIPTQLAISKSCGCASQPGDIVDSAQVENEALESLVVEDRTRDNAFRMNAYAREYLIDRRLNGHPQSEQNVVAQLGVGFLQVSLLDRPEDGLGGTARLLVAWQDHQKQELPPDGQEFSARKLLPSSWEPEQRMTLHVGILSEASTLFGFHVMPYGVSATGIEQFGTALSESILAVQMTKKLERLNEELRSAQAKLETLSLTDELTGHFNRRGFLAHAQQLSAYCRRQVQPFCVLYLDLDGLKKINDNYGHDDGDLAIRSLGEVLRKAFRSTDVVARLGGDEFTILAADAGDRGLAIIRRRIDVLLEEKNRELVRPWRLQASIGAYSSLPGDTATLAQMMELADQGLYLEKRAKKGAPQG